MARMIPPRFAKDASNGEKEIFRLLEHDPGTEGWIVLHSFALSRHESKREAEIDLVVLVPDFGILCLEVKGTTVSRREGIWHYGYGTSVEGPFRQASTAMHSLRMLVASKESDCSGILFWSGVVFTAQKFSEESPEWHSWQHVDAMQLASNPISILLGAILEKAHQHAKSRTGARFNYDKVASRPTSRQLSRLANLLRGDFEAVSSPRASVIQAEQAIKRLTEEQYRVLDSLEDNDRVLVNGLAGTGKSLLAIEAARRKAHAGNRVLLVCFNKLLGRWMSDQVRDLNDAGVENLHARHLHGLMIDIAGRKSVEKPHKEYWETDLPEQALERILDDAQSLCFDYIVIDEAQDILRDQYLDVLDALLRGGLRDGKWIMFGDFANQAIYSKSGDSQVDELIGRVKSRSSSIARLSLRTNCRNARPISHALTVVCNLDPSYQGVMSDLPEGSVDPSFWKDESGQANLLSNIILSLRDAFEEKEIIILSTRQDSSSCAFKLGSAGDAPLVPLRDAGDQTRGIPFVSIHAFKGLEASAVIVTDIMTLDDWQRSLLYVAMSRARVRLELLMHEECRKSYKELLFKNLRIGK